jgi:hypothetical protein
MVEAVRQGRSQREVARACHVALFTLQWWVKRAEGRALDQVQWANRSRAPARVHNRTDLAIELAVLECRQRLHATSVLGFYGAQAIHETLWAEATLPRVPSVRTIGRILERHGALDRRRRLRHPAPPPGWYVPAVRTKHAELDAVDVIEGLVIEGRGDVEVLTGKALWGYSAGVWPMPAVTAKVALEALLSHWQAHGLPQFVQFDNDTRFQGGHNHPDVLGRIVRACLSLGLTPVFVPPRESGFQAVIENFNGLWQRKVWTRFHHVDLSMLQSRSAQFVAAYRQRLAQRTDPAPPRRPFPTDWHLNLQAPLSGQVIYLRRTDADGVVSLLGRRFQVDPLWTHRLVRCEVNCDHHSIAFYRLRRREPEQQPLVKIIAYRFPRRPFRE